MPLFDFPTLKSLVNARVRVTIIYFDFTPFISLVEGGIWAVIFFISLLEIFSWMKEYGLPLIDFPVLKILVNGRIWVIII